MAEDIIEKYKARIEKELGKKDAEEKFLSYSEEYKNFKREQVSVAHSAYEKACNFSQSLLKLKIAPADVEKIAPAIKLAHLNIRPEGVYAFTYFSVLITISISALLAIVFNFRIIIFGLLAAVVLLSYLPAIPKQILTSWRAKASDQLVLAVLYIIIYMQHTPNLERAVKFVAEHISPPLSLDFIKILWDLESKVYSSVTVALEDYAETWKDYDNEFIEAIHLIESSLYEPSPQRKKEILDQAIKVILDGTQDHMLNFAHNLQSPMEALHMLGVVLPIMGLVMLPMVSAFMGASVKWYYLVLLYNLVLPLSVYAIGKSVLETRPAGADTADVYLFMKNKYAEKSKKPAMLGLASFFAISGPALFYVASIARLPSEEIMAKLFSQIAIFASLDLVLAAGLSLGIYYHLSISGLMKVKKQIENMESEFSSAIFQLGEKLEERKPQELAISEVAETVKAADVAKFFQIIMVNMSQLGAGLKDAIFDEKYGALSYYPSAIIRSTMSLFIEGIKKGPEIAGNSLLVISDYLRSVHKVTERMKDLLADTVSSMSSQAKAFAPIISGVVVGLSVLVTTIMRNLGLQLQSISAGEAGVGVGAGLLDVFQISAMLPPTFFQLIVGTYLIEITFLLSYLLSGIIYGKDDIEQRSMLSQNLIISTVFYVVITGVTVLLFQSLVAPLVQLQFGA